HFHTDHPVFSCSIIEQKQLNTWVSFQSAEQPLLGQFSVSGNSSAQKRGFLDLWRLLLVLGGIEHPGSHYLERIAPAITVFVLG
ncbi:hypothetical protein L4528_32265, partial [Pseudomonas aeruginosa]